MQIVFPFDMSYATIQKVEEDVRMSRNYKCLLRYFNGREEISSIFAHNSGGGIAVAVLVRDAGMDARTIASLEARYYREASARTGEIISVEVLNAAPAWQQYRVLRDWTLLSERNRSFRAWFFEQAALSCHETVVTV